MELNRERIINEIESLVKTLKATGGWVKKESGEGWFNHEILSDALALIRELTESLDRVQKQCGELIVECDERDAERLMQVAKLNAENKRLQAEIAESAKEFTCAFGQPHSVSDCPIAEEVAKAKADTVRKMQKMLELEAYLEGGEFCVLVSDVDKIARELLEEGGVQE